MYEGGRRSIYSIMPQELDEGIQIPELAWTFQVLFADIVEHMDCSLQIRNCSKNAQLQGKQCPASSGVQPGYARYLVISLTVRYCLLDMSCS